MKTNQNLRAAVVSTLIAAAVWTFPMPHFSFDWLLKMPPKPCAVVSNEIKITVVQCSEKAIAAPIAAKVVQ